MKATLFNKTTIYTNETPTRGHLMVCITKGHAEYGKVIKNHITIPETIDTKNWKVVVSPFITKKVLELLGTAKKLQKTFSKTGTHWYIETLVKTLIEKDKTPLTTYTKKIAISLAKQQDKK
jgi:hypothetical protein